MPFPASLVEITVDGVDITERVLFERTNFRSVGNALPGSFTVAVRDDDHDFEVRSGAVLRLIVDGIPLFGGYVKRKGRNHFFPVQDSTSPGEVPRLWMLAGPDANILFDKLVLHDPDDHFGPMNEPGGRVGAMVRYAISHFIDHEDRFDYESQTDHDEHYPKGQLVDQGKYLREQMEDFAQYGGAVYYIDGDWVLHFHTYQSSRVSWGFTDYRPDRVKWVGFREATYDEDALEMVTDALIWGGSSLHQPGTDPGTGPGIGTVFARYPDPPAKTYTIPGSSAWQTRLDENIDEDANQFRVRSVKDIPDIGTGSSGLLDIVIDAETMHVHDREGTLLKVVRGTVKASHSAGTKVFHHAEEPHYLTKKLEEDAFELQDKYGRWQRAEMRPGQEMYLTEESVRLRAYTIINGPTGIDPATGIESGYNKPQKAITLSWFAHDVPNFEHIRPGYIVDFQLYTMGKDLHHPLVFSLPCRSISISFPTLPNLNPEGANIGYVRFDGEFGISLSESRKLWAELKRRNRAGSVRAAQGVRATVDNTSTGAVAGSRGTFYVQEDPNGSRQMFSIPFGYHAGTTQVYVNGLLWRVNVEYRESSPADGEITFYKAPESDDTIFIVCIVNNH